MELKDIQAAITKARQYAERALTVIAECEDTLQEQDHCITLCKQLDAANELDAILEAGRTAVSATE